MRFIQIWIRKLWPKQSVRVFVQLLGCLEIFLVAPIVLKLTLIRCVIAADLGTRFIDAASMIVLKMFALRVNQQEPDIVLDEQAGSIVHHEPSQVLEVIKIRWCFNR